MKTFHTYLTILCACLLLVACQSNSSAPSPEIETGNSTEISATSDITCPACGHTETETLPTKQCLLFYDCKKCGKTMAPEGDDCCVFCTHGTHECPSIQERNQ